MEGELYNLFKVWFSVFASLFYCFAIGRTVPKGTARFFCFLPILCLFLLLPLNLSSIHFGGITAFFIAWLANFKLALHAFGKGPLSSSDDDSPSISFSSFLPVACFPIKIQQKFHPNGQDKQNPVPKKGHKSIPNYAVKGLLLAMLVRVYDYREFIHPKESSLNHSSMSHTSQLRFKTSGVEDGISWSAVSCGPPYMNPSSKHLLQSLAAGGSTSCNLGHLCRVGCNARAHALLLGPRETHVGNHLVLSATWSVFGGRGCLEEGGCQKMVLSEVHINSFDRWVCAGDRFLAVLSTASQV
ncbi:hypothetical protein GH714_010318 [Hevea brasiliensis]|uniref:Uncharacterized protein n=1 Tax=Hevea brasiliensis TaxID=3981 RepID=A0A6A6KZB2_HEVBR|nr:hypothetical protein GH714_010318 [Hevea brasiliensis]